MTINKCKNKSCNRRAVYLNEFCWDHLNQKQKDSYPQKIIDEIIEKKEIVGESFQKIVFKNTYFPENAAFRKCDFTQAIIKHCSFPRADFRGSNFNCAVIKDCRLEYSDFRGTDTFAIEADLRETHFDGASMQNADLTGADLRDAILINADLIGAMLLYTQLYASRLMNTRIRKESLCNFEPINPRNIRVSDENFDGKEIVSPLEAKYVYMSLKNNFKSIGEYEDEKWAHLKARIMERNRLYRLGFLKDRNCDSLALERWEPEDNDKIFESPSKARWKYRLECFQNMLGYGENPFIFFGLSAITIFAFSFIFLLSGFDYGSEPINRDVASFFFDFRGTLSDLGTAVYVSIVTFSTLGYGDACPTGVTRIFASIEALLGLVLMSSYVATFLRKLIRD